jgi:hypothetical protein
VRGDFKFGHIGFCLKAKKPVKNTIDNLLLCPACSFFRVKDGLFLKGGGKWV